MKKRNLKKIFATLSLALALSNSTTAYAYSNEDLKKIEEEVENYIDEEIESSSEESVKDSCESYLKLQSLISKIPTEYYYELVDSINTYDTLKKVMKDFIDPYMCDAAKEAIVFANTTDKKEDILWHFKTFFESRCSDSRSNSDERELKNINVLDNREGKLNIGKNMYLFDNITEHENYKVFYYYGSEYGSDEQYYFITDKNNKVLAYISSIDYQMSYEYVGDKNVHIGGLKDELNSIGLSSELHPTYTYDDLATLTFKISNAINNSTDNKIKAENILTLEVPEDGADWLNSLDGNEDNRYFFIYDGPYQFKEGYDVYKDLYNPDANITLDNGMKERLLYKNYVTDVYIRLRSSNDDFKYLMPINDYLRLKGLDNLIKDEYTKEEIHSIRIILDTIKAQKGIKRVIR